MPQPVELGDLRHRVTVSPAETAVLLGLGRDTVRDLLETTDDDLRLPAFRVGTRWLIPVAELDAWASRNVHRHRKATT